MKDFDQEFRYLIEQQAELNAKIQARNRAEYIRLLGTVLLTLASQALAAASFYTTIRRHHVHIPWEVAIWGTIAAAFLAVLFAFYRNASKTTTGAGAFIKNETALLVNELPNIIQIVSVIGLLGALLKQISARITVTVVVTVLLMIYLTSKRNKLPGNTESLSSKITIPLSLADGLCFGSIAYYLASLIAQYL